MKSKIMSIVAGLLLVFSVNSYAQGVSVSAKASTLGAGLEAEKTFSESFGARVGVNYFQFDYTGTKDDIEYDFDINFQSVSLLLDWHPFKSGFRVSGGALYNGNKIDAKSKSSATYKVGDVTYTAADIASLDGDIEFNDVAPYVGLGWDTSFGKQNKFGFLFEIGAIYQGSPEVGIKARGPIATDPTFQSELREEEKNLEKELDDYAYYPVIALGFTYRF